MVGPKLIQSYRDTACHNSPWIAVGPSRKREFNMLGSKLFVSFMDRARSWPENVAFASLAL